LVTRGHHLSWRTVGGEIAMLLLLIIILLFFGGFGSFHAYNNWGAGGGVGIGTIVLIIIVMLLLFGNRS
jgi:hypothetical protein